MQPPIHISKIIPPQNPQILPRPRLIKQLDRHQDKKLILILGQAAQGKSTLAVSYVNTSAVPSAWVNLSPNDTEAVDLFYLLAGSLQRVFSEKDFTSALSYPAVTLGPREEAPLYRDWLLSLLDLATFPVQIILDGLDRLPAGAQAFRLLQVLLDILPPHLRLFILSREMPPMDIQKLAEREAVFRLTNADLAFTLGETTSYFQTIRKFHISPDLVQRIHRLTEGWIGGLVLFCDSLDWVPEGQRESYISQELAGKFIWNIFQYFGERILALLPREVQEFLIKSSILDIVEPDFVGAAMGLANAQEVLEELVKRNLFVQSIYDKKKGWSFRYHPLFKEFLQAKFQSLLAQEHQIESYYQAASVSERREDLETAVRFYLKSRSYPKAASALEKVGLELARLGKTAELGQWLAVLPKDLVQENSWLLFYHFITGRFSGHEEYLFSLQKAYTLFGEQGDTRGLLLTLAYLIEASIDRGHESIPNIHLLLSQAEDLVDCPAAQPFPLERAVLWCQIGFAHYLRSGTPRKGIWACNNADLLGRNLGLVPLQINALIHTLGCHTFLGEFARAGEVLKQAGKLLENCPYPELQAFYLVNAAQFYRVKGDLPKAVKALQEARETTEHHGLTNLYHVVLTNELILKNYQGEFDPEESGVGLANMWLSQGNLFMYGRVLLHLGLGAYRQNDYARARELLRRAREVFSSEEGRSELQLSLVKTSLGLTGLHLDGNVGDWQDLKEAQAHFQEAGILHFLRESHLALALWEWEHGEKREAAAHLEAGQQIAREQGYEANIILNREDILQACILCLELDLEDCWDCAAQLLATRLADLSRPELARLSLHPNRKVADKAWEIRKTIQRTTLPHLHFQTLGGFRLWRGESMVEDKEWEGHQPQLLLKAMLSHDPKGVPKDVLMEDLWPEASPELAEKNLKVNLHRLRKTLEPTMDKMLGSSYVHLKANLVSLDPELCQVDLEEFLSLCQNGKKKEEAGEIKGAIFLYQQAMGLYGGEYLAEELYHSWAAVKREELRGKFIALLYRSAKLYEGQGSRRKAIDCYNALLESDPLAEPAYRSLMLLFDQRGMRNAALRAYQECRQSLQKTLNAEPEEATTAIYRKILESVGRLEKVKSGA
jgi:ATP/maltotriose-dependent transcriptional regulator MalT/DNA-binding SARP family transcriptional activator